MSSSKSYKTYINKNKNIVTCPICKKSGDRSHISRHIMNSEDEKHNNFVKDQISLLKIIYNSEEILDISKICCRDDIWCSPSYVRKIYRILPDYKKKLSNTRSIKTKQQYKNGRKSYITAGWKPKNRKEAGRRVISDERYNKIIELYNSTMTLKDISKEVSCKPETVSNYWIKIFGKEEVSKRNKLSKIRKISVLNDDKIKLIKKYFYENRTKHYIASELKISTGTVLNFFRKNFTIEERKAREEALRYKIKCPVCGKLYKPNGLSNHLFKQKDEDHLSFIKKIDNEIINAFYKDISCTELSPELSKKIGFNVSFGYIYSKWRRMKGYEERKKVVNSLSIKKQWDNGKRSLPSGLTNKGNKYFLISDEKVMKIKELFHHDLSFKDIAESVNCNKKTVRSVMVKLFGEEKTRNRCKNICKIYQSKSSSRQKVKNRDKKLYDRIIRQFNTTIGARDVAKLNRTTFSSVKEIWIEKFGYEKYNNRKIKMKIIQNRRSIKTLKKSKFMGSKPERNFYKMLKINLGNRSIVHHDHKTVFPLEIDISIPNKKIAICWDGICHRKPIFGSESFKRTKKNDAIRKRELKEKGWTHIIIKDNGYFSKADMETFVNVVRNIYFGKIKRQLIYLE